MKKNVKVILFIIIILIILFIVYLYIQKPHKTEEPELEGVKIAQAIPVKVTIARKDTLINYIHAEGTAESQQYWDAITEVPGTVEKINFYNGDYVKKDDLIIKLKNDELEQQLITAIINYQKKYTQYLSLKTIMPDKIKQNDIDISRLIDSCQNSDQIIKKLQKTIITEIDKEAPQKYIALREAAADLQQLFAKYQKLSFDAPFAGIMGDLQIKTDNYVGAGSKIFRLSNSKKMDLIVTVMESELVRLKKNAKVYITFMALPNKLFMGKIKSINPNINKKTRLGEVKIEFSNFENKITDGMFGQCFIVAEKFPDLLLIPNIAVLERDNRKLVFIKKDGCSYWCYVKIGKNNANYTEIVKGINPLDTVIVSGQFTLIHNSKLNITEIIPFNKFDIKEKLINRSKQELWE